MALFHKSVWSDPGPIFSAVEVSQDLLIFCENGTLATSQVLLAAASTYLRSLLVSRHEKEESGVQVIIVPEIKMEVLIQVIELLVTGSTA